MFASHIVDAIGGPPERTQGRGGAFIGNATPHGWSRTRGEAAPVWVTLRDQGQQLAERFPAVADLFDALRDYAERQIRDDEALDSRDE